MQKYLILLLAVGLLAFSGCGKKKTETQFEPNAEELQKINELRLDIVRFHQKWSRMGTLISSPPPTKSS